MRKLHKNSNRKFIVIAIVLLLAISIGYAALSTTLTINGTANIAANSWLVYFTNVQVKTGSVTATQVPTTSGTSTTTLTWAVNLQTPGDYYEYNVDVKNDGTIDAMIGSLSNTSLTTNQAKYCLAVGAKRNNTELIAVVLGAETSQERFKLASDLLNYGFSNFESKTIFSSKDLINKTLTIKGSNEVVNLKAEKDYSIISKIGEDINFSLNFNLPQTLTEVKENQVVGNVEIVVNGIVVDTINILSCSTINETTVWDYFRTLIA